VRIHQLTRRIRPRLGRRDERGGVAVVVAGLIVPFTLLGAFVIDLGMTYAQAQAFAAGADSGALAIARYNQDLLTKNPTTYTTCAQLLAADPAATNAKAIARQQADANGPFNLTSASGQVSVDVSVSCTPSGVLKAVVTVQRDVPTTLGRIAGVQSLHAERNATAGVSRSSKVGGVFPLAICDQQADAILATAAAGAPYPSVVIETDKVWQPGCTSNNGGNGNGNGNGNSGGNGSGNWGWLDCNAPNNGIPSIVNHINNGCDVSLQGHPASVQMGGTPGNKINAGPLETAILGAIGKTYAFPVYDTVSSQGAGTQYRVVGFLELQVVALSSGELTVKYVSYSPTAEFDGACGIGGSDCAAYNVVATALLS
jgi:Flp pilus assembly protein TadG